MVMALFISNECSLPSRSMIKSISSPSLDLRKYMEGFSPKCKNLFKKSFTTMVSNRFPKYGALTRQNPRVIEAQQIGTQGSIIKI